MLKTKYIILYSVRLKLLNILYIVKLNLIKIQIYISCLDIVKKLNAQKVHARIANAHTVISRYFGVVDIFKDINLHECFQE